MKLLSWLQDLFRSHFMCPRRTELSSLLRLTGFDYWMIKNGYKVCSHCGSLRPEVLLFLIKHRLCDLAPSNSDNKVYVYPIYKEATLKFYFQHLSSEQKRMFIDLYESNRIRFRKYVPGKKDVIVPRGFYILPFFMRRL